MKYSYWRQFLIAFDQMINAIFAGWADETISARAWRQHTNYTRWAIGMKVIDWIMFWQKSHCHQAYLAELYRDQVPPEERKSPVT